LHGKYEVGFVVKGAVRVRLRRLKGTFIVKFFVDSLARKVKDRDEGEEMIFVYCGSAVFQKYKPYLALYVTGSCAAIASHVLFGRCIYGAKELIAIGSLSPMEELPDPSRPSRVPKVQGDPPESTVRLTSNKSMAPIVSGVPC
jgi:hypothetical protein